MQKRIECYPHKKYQSNLSHGCHTTEHESPERYNHNQASSSNDRPCPVDCECHCFWWWLPCFFQLKHHIQQKHPVVYTETYKDWEVERHWHEEQWTIIIFIWITIGIIMLYKLIQVVLVKKRKPSFHINKDCKPICESQH